MFASRIEVIYENNKLVNKSAEAIRDETFGSLKNNLTSIRPDLLKDAGSIFAFFTEKFNILDEKKDSVIGEEDSRELKLSFDKIWLEKYSKLEKRS